MEAMQKVAIHDFNGSTVELTAWTLLQWKHALKLEMVGLRHSQGSVAAHVRKILSCPRNYPIAELQAHLARSWDDIMSQLEAAA